jgi:hypothetical protein
VNEDVDDGVAGVLFEPPHTSCLRRRQPKARHFDEFGADAAQDNF